MYQIDTERHFRDAMTGLHVPRTVSVTIEPRPAYCDRGHWFAKAYGPLDIAAADSFPRYFMDLERAKAEMKEWLVWRVQRLESTG
jgi:hypothetical protein